KVPTYSQAAQSLQSKFDVKREVLSTTKEQPKLTLPAKVKRPQHPSESHDDMQSQKEPVSHVDSIPSSQYPSCGATTILATSYTSYQPSPDKPVKPSSTFRDKKQDRTKISPVMFRHGTVPKIQDHRRARSAPDRTRSKLVHPVISPVVKIQPTPSQPVRQIDEHRNQTIQVGIPQSGRCSISPISPMMVKSYTPSSGAVYRSPPSRPYASWSPVRFPRDWRMSSEHQSPEKSSSRCTDFFDSTAIIERMKFTMEIIVDFLDCVRLYRFTIALQFRQLLDALDSFKLWLMRPLTVTHYDVYISQVNIELAELEEIVHMLRRHKTDTAERLSALEHYRNELRDDEVHLLYDRKRKQKVVKVLKNYKKFLVQEVTHLHQRLTLALHGLRQIIDNAHSSGILSNSSSPLVTGVDSLSLRRRVR
ncbi:uncharacterized protein DEA37_0011210, partial [Paragonimus westermani]